MTSSDDFRAPVAEPADTEVGFSADQVKRLGHWLSECLDDAAPLNEHLWAGCAAWMVKGPTFQGVMRELLARRDEKRDREAVGRVVERVEAVLPLAISHPRWEQLDAQELARKVRAALAETGL